MTAVPVGFHADFQDLARLRNEARAQDPAALKTAAQQFESLFTQMLLKSMREASKSFGDSLFGSDQGDFYQGMFDDQLAMQLSQGSGLGLADMLIRQLSMAGGEQAASVPREGTAAAGIHAARWPQDPRGRAGAQVDAAGGPVGRAGGMPAGGQPGVASGKDDFVRSLWPHARQAASELGVDPHALLAQAALETGWGRSVPCTAEGRCSFNLFGIKTGGHWPGASVSVPTLEFEAGVAVRRVERFRAYDSAAESFRDYALLIGGSPRYRTALNTGGDVASFAAALQRGGYATDPRYAQKILAVAADVRATVQAQGLEASDAQPHRIEAGAGRRAIDRLKSSAEVSITRNGVGT